MLLANGTFPTNADGIAVGGIRTPWINAPVVALTGVGGSRSGASWRSATTAKPPCQHVTDLIDQHLAQVEQRLAELAQARNALRDLKRRASATDPADCSEDRVCSILTVASQG
jgi:hypothetical protein